MPGRGEPGDVADLGDEHRRPGGADPGDLLDRPIAGMGGQPGGDPPGGQLDLPIEGVDQPTVGVDPSPVSGIQRSLGELGATTRPEQIRHRDV
jgi:hypothetical protein